MGTHLSRFPARFGSSARNLEMSLEERKKKDPLHRIFPFDAASTANAGPHPQRSRSVFKPHADSLVWTAEQASTYPSELLRLPRNCGQDLPGLALATLVRASSYTVTRRPDACKLPKSDHSRRYRLQDLSHWACLN